jgi:hypothetical protein
MPKLKELTSVDAEERVHSYLPDLSSHLATHGPDSAELAKAVEAVRASLIMLETPKIVELISHYLTPFGAWPVQLEVITDGKEVPLDYRPMPPLRTIGVNAHVYIRGRGRPMPYPLEEE